jgi:hypothetical protein
MMEERDQCLSNISSFMIGEKECHLRKMTNYNPNNIMFAESGRQTTQKFHGNRFPWMGWNW